MSHEQVSIATADGECPAHVLTPAGKGAWPAVILYMDGFGIRPTLVQMAARLADHGYVVLLPDLYYRFGHYDTLDPMEIYARGQRSIIAPLRATIDNPKAAQDTGFFLDYLESRPDVAAGGFGLVGFCMGGGFALAAAGTFPDRVIAVATFHGGYLATDDPASPHLLAPRMKAEIYVAGAENDSSYPPEMARRLEQALGDAGVMHRCEIYPGTQHSWMIPDFPVYDAAASERGWSELIVLLERALPGE